MISRNEQFRFGSARWATYDEIEAAGLFEQSGLPFGFYEDRLLRYASDAPRILIGGAGSGKLTGILSYCLCLPCSMSMAVLDPKGELWDISVGTLAAQNIFGYSWDPFHIGDVRHTINPLDHLKRGRRTLFAEIERQAVALIPSVQASAGRYFEITAQSVLIMLIYSEVLMAGGIDFPRLYQLIHMIEGDIERWTQRLDHMLSSDVEFIRSQASSILRCQTEAPKEFSGVIGELYAYMRWLADDAVRDSLKGNPRNDWRGDASLREFITPSLNGGHKVRFHFKVPGDLIIQLAPALRVFFDVIMMLKARTRGTAPTALIIDEAAQLGKFKALKDAFSYGRGSGTIPLAVFQDLGQLESNFSRPEVTTFLGSAAHRQFIGTRDHITAGVISTMCGYETLEFDDEGRQADAERQMLDSLQAIMDGADPFEHARRFEHYRTASNRKSKMKRALIDPSEVMNMREDEAISFISGKDVAPIFHNKYPYYERLRSGRFFPNPNHPPTDKIKVKTLWGHKWLAVNRIPVPQKYAQFPQYQTGFALQIENHLL